MAKYSKQNEVSDQTKQESLAIAKGIQKPGQTKEQTKLIAQGIQKGISQYKKQQKAKARELDKFNKREAAKKVELSGEAEPPKQTQQKLPWILLILSWLCFSLIWFSDLV